jgi:hypothetical protein
MFRLRQPRLLAAALLLALLALAAPLQALAPAPMESVTVNVLTAEGHRIYGTVGRVKEDGKFVLRGKLWVTSGALKAPAFAGVEKVSIPNRDEAYLTVKGTWQGQAGRLVVNLVKSTHSVFATFTPDGEDDPTLSVAADKDDFNESWEKISVVDNLPDNQIPPDGTPPTGG